MRDVALFEFILPSFKLKVRVKNKMFLKNKIKVIFTCVFLVLLIVALSFIPFEQFNSNFYESVAKVFGFILFILSWIFIWGNSYF